MLAFLDRLLATYGAGLVGFVVALEAMGLPLPGESLIIAAAIYSATTHHIAIGWLLLSAIIGAVLGDNLGYAIGRTVGFRLLDRYGGRLGLSADRLMLGRFLFQRYGGMVVFSGRFVAVLRTLAALLAGANHMDWRRFLFWNAFGGICWAGGYGIIAYTIGLEIKRLQSWLGATIGIVAFTAVVFIVVYLKRNERRLIVVARKASETQASA